MDFILKVLRWFEFFSFGFANFFVFLFFWCFLSSVPIIYFLIAGGVAICVLKIQWLFLLADKYREVGKDSTSRVWSNIISTVKRIRGFAGLFSVKTFAVIIKQLMINIVYEAFPVLLIWLGVLGTSYLIGVFIGPASYSPNVHFFEILTSFGIVLGVFQYYLKRHEEKIATRITHFSQRISAIISGELNFERFYSNLTKIDGGKEIIAWIDRNTDPKMRFIELLKLMAEDKDIIKLFSRRRSEGGINFSFPVSYANSDDKFNQLETYASGIPMRKKLQRVYDSFFEDEKIDEIIEKIKEDIDIQEFGNLCLGNINILQEVFPQLINRKLRTEVVNLYFHQECNNEGETFHSFKKRREMFEGRITRKLMKEILGCL